MGEMTPSLWIAQSLLSGLKNCAAMAYPLECCGLLVGYDEQAEGDGVIGKRVSRILPTQNCATTPQHAFEIDPAAHIALLRSLREQAWDGQGRHEQLLGHYHSHPDAAAIPSARDRAQAMETGAVWVIVATSAVGAGDMTAWQAINEGDGTIGFQPMTVVRTDG
jgi:proteasome lid subunit RPN8/RPN11